MTKQPDSPRTDRRGAQADLCFLLPLRSGGRAAIFGEAPELAERLQEEGIHSLVLTKEHESGKPSGPGERDVHGKNGIDYVFVPELTNAQVPWIRDEILRVLKPGGWLFLGVRNRVSLYRLIEPLKRVTRFQNARWQRRQKSDSRFFLSVRSCRRWLEAKHFEVISYHGVFEGLRQPRYWVPLPSPSSTRYFFERLFVPHSRRAVALQRICFPIIALGLQQTLFADLAVVARHLPNHERES